MENFNLYKECRLCPRVCGVDRTSPGEAGRSGRCGESSMLRLAFAGLHSGEEPPLSGKGGSGTIFVCGCNLGCAFCQNWQISGGGGRMVEMPGRAVSTEEFADICLKLQGRGAENINIVTGSHAVPAIAAGITTAKSAGLTIPILWNSSGYDNPAALELLGGLVDIFLPDLKTLDPVVAAEFCGTAGYPTAAAKAIQWMVQHKAGGVIVRHLVLPGRLDSTREVFRWFAENAAGGALLSVMSQYTPIEGSDGPGRFLSGGEYKTVLGWLDEFGIENGFCQELVTGNDWLPDFRQPNPFSSELSVPVWHYGSSL